MVRKFILKSHLLDCGTSNGEKGERSESEW